MKYDCCIDFQHTVTKWQSGSTGFQPCNWLICTCSEWLQSVPTWLIGAILAVTVVIVHSVIGNGAGAIQACERFTFFIKLPVWRDSIEEIHQCHDSCKPCFSREGWKQQECGYIHITSLNAQFWFSCQIWCLSWWFTFMIVSDLYLTQVWTKLCNKKTTCIHTFNK